MTYALVAIVVAAVVAMVTWEIARRVDQRSAPEIALAGQTPGAARDGDPTPVTDEGGGPTWASVVDRSASS